MRYILPMALMVGGMLIGSGFGVIYGVRMFADATLLLERLRLSELEDIAFEGYCSSDIALGEGLLLRHAEVVEQFIDMGLTSEIPGKSDLRQDLVLTYGRLGVLVEASGDEAKAGQYYALAIRNWDSMEHREGDGKMSIQKLKMWVATFDAIEEENSQPDAAPEPPSAGAGREAAETMNPEPENETPAAGGGR